MSRPEISTGQLATTVEPLVEKDHHSPLPLAASKSEKPNWSPRTNSALSVYAGLATAYPVFWLVEQQYIRP
jgi:hypothetical protein